MIERARGSYRYWCNGVLQAITEPWQLQQTTRGLLLCGQRLVNDLVVLNVDADYDGAACTEMRLRWHAPTQELGVYYRHCGTNLEWQFDGERAVRVMALPIGSRLFPLLRAATGPLLRQLVSTSRSVIVPCIRDASADEFLHPLSSERRAAVLEGQHYRYYGGEYAEVGCDCWLAPNGLLLRYQWQSPQGDWEVRLEDLWTAPGFEGFV